MFYFYSRSVSVKALVKILHQKKNKKEIVLLWNCLNYRFFLPFVDKLMVWIAELLFFEVLNKNIKYKKSLLIVVEVTHLFTKNKHFLKLTSTV